MNSEEDNIEKSRLPLLTNFLRKFPIFIKAQRCSRVTTRNSTSDIWHVEKTKKKKKPNTSFTVLHVHFSASQKRTQPRHHITLHKTTAFSSGSTKAEVVPWSNGAWHLVQLTTMFHSGNDDNNNNNNVPAALKLNPKHLRGVSVSPATLEDPSVTGARLNLISADVHVWDSELVLHNSNASHLVFRAACRDACWSPHT